jgi:hypothetical protein
MSQTSETLRTIGPWIDRYRAWREQQRAKGLPIDRATFDAWDGRRPQAVHAAGRVAAPALKAPRRVPRTPATRGIEP